MTNNTHPNIVHTQYIATVFHVLFEVFFQIFKYQGEMVFSVDDVMKRNCKSNTKWQYKKFFKNSFVLVSLQALYSYQCLHGGGL